LVLHGQPSSLNQAIISHGYHWDTILLTCERASDLQEFLPACRHVSRRIGLVVTDATEAHTAMQPGVDFVVAKGIETAGRVGTLSSTALTEQLLAFSTIPVWIWGGTDLPAAGMQLPEGVAGLILDWQLALLSESSVSQRLRFRLQHFQSNDTCLVRLGERHSLRVSASLARAAVDELQSLSLAKEQTSVSAITAICDRVDSDLDPALIGLDATYAKRIASEAGSLSKVLGRFKLAANRNTSSDKPTPAQPPLDIAIVGLGCLMPGATSIDQFWTNILEKRDLVQQVPADQFEIERWYDPDRKARDKTLGKWGGFLGDIPFNPLKYGIPPAALTSIEPGQLLALEVVEQALGDAGYLEANPHRERTSVVFGVSGGMGDLGQNYIVRSLLPQFLEKPDTALWEQLPEWTEDSFPGILPNVISGRISNRFDLGGENYTVDAACASSLAAVHLACRGLADGSSDLVICGGCDLVQGPFAYLCFSKAGALSPTGRSRVFDRDADGIAISEGLAAVVLKRLTDAERDGDRIYAVIRAVAGSSDGRNRGLTAPHPQGQLRALRRAYEMAGISPSTVELFEAHGTGTPVGDATEIESLSALLQEGAWQPGQAAVGSVKSIIGHTKSTAGVAGLIKAALALHHRIVPPTIHVHHPIVSSDSPLYVNADVRPWIRGAQPRRAGVSAFGFGGTNFHAVLEEHHGALPEKQRPTISHWPAELFLFSAQTVAQLCQRLRATAETLRKLSDLPNPVALSDLAYTLFLRSVEKQEESDWPCLAVVSSSIEQLVEQLTRSVDALQSGQPGKPNESLPREVYFRTGQASGVPVAVLFPGQGAQFPGMVQDLAIAFGEVSASFEQADSVLNGAFDRPLSRYVFPPAAFNDQQRTADLEQLQATQVAQPALGAAGLGLYRLLRNFGVRPSAAAGHSYGELVALCVAGSLSQSDLYRLSWARDGGVSAIIHHDRHCLTRWRSGHDGQRAGRARANPHLLRRAE
jgi:acyl transferase domain-containing protein